MNSSVKTLASLLFILGSFTAAAGTVKTWDLTSMRVNRNANVQEAVVKKIKAAIEQHCDDLSGGEDTVKLVSESLNHVDYYNFYGSELLELEYTSYEFVRTSGDRSYTVSVETSWDYDLPIPMVDAMVESTNCSFRP